MARHEILRFFLLPLYRPMQGIADLVVLGK